MDRVNKLQPHTPDQMALPPPDYSIGHGLAPEQYRLPGNMYTAQVQPSTAAPDLLPQQQLYGEIENIYGYPPKQWSASTNETMSILHATYSGRPSSATQSNDDAFSHPTNSETPNPKTITLKAHRCDFCGKAFADSRGLNKHTRTHADNSIISSSPAPLRPQQTLNQMRTSRELGVMWIPNSRDHVAPPPQRQRSPPPSSIRASQGDKAFDTYRPKVRERSRSSTPSRSTSPQRRLFSRSPPKRRGGRRDSPAQNNGRKRRSPSYSSYSSYDDRSRSRSRGRVNRGSRPCSPARSRILPDSRPSMVSVQVPSAIMYYNADRYSPRQTTELASVGDDIVTDLPSLSTLTDKEDKEVEAMFRIMPKFDTIDTVPQRIRGKNNEDGYQSVSGGPGQETKQTVSTKPISVGLEAKYERFSNHPWPSAASSAIGALHFIHGSSFMISTTSGLSEIPSYKDFSEAEVLVESLSFGSDYPPSSNRNSVKSSSRMSPIASPRMTGRTQAFPDGDASSRHGGRDREWAPPGLDLNSNILGDNGQRFNAPGMEDFALDFNSVMSNYLAGYSTGALTDREKRKLAMLEESFRKIDQDQPPRKKKKTSGGSTMRVPRRFSNPYSTSEYTEKADTLRNPMEGEGQNSTKIVSLDRVHSGGFFKQIWWQGYCYLEASQPETFTSLNMELEDKYGKSPSDPSDYALSERISALIKDLSSKTHDKPELQPLISYRENIIKIMKTISTQLGLNMSVLGWACVGVLLSVCSATFSF